MSLKTINVNGTSYEIGVSLAKIAEALGLTEDRFVELLSRDLYCPTLTSAPTSSTRTYTDTDNSTNTFQIGQTCRWLDGSTYKIAILADITDSEASWYTMPEDWASQLSAKQDKNIYFTGLSASSWVSDSAYADYPYRCDIACTGVTADMYAEVIFDVTEAQSGNYAPICETKSGAVVIWSKENTAIQIPTITITK